MGPATPCLRPLMATPRVRPEPVFAASPLLFLQHTFHTTPNTAQGATEQQSCPALHRLEADSGPHTWRSPFLANSKMNKNSAWKDTRVLVAQAACGLLLATQKNGSGAGASVLKPLSPHTRVCRHLNLGTRQRAALTQLSPVISCC